MANQARRFLSLNSGRVTSSSKNLLRTLMLSSSSQYEQDFGGKARNGNQKCKGQKQTVLNIESRSGRRSKIQVSPPPFAMTSQSVILPGAEKVRACGAVEKPQKALEFPDTTTRSVSDVFHRGLLKSQSGKCLGSRSPQSEEYEWISYAEVAERTSYVGSGLISLGISATQSTKIGICTKTRTEFVLTMLATSSYSMVLVPVYECLESEALFHIISQVEMPVIICESDKIAHLIIQNAEKFSHLKHIILLKDSVDINSPHLNIMTFKELEEAGKSNTQKPKNSNPDDMFCICYTSGTTGSPKGVMFSHRNILSCIASMESIIGVAVPETGTLMAYLPCAHIYEMINEIYCLYRGGQMGFLSGNSDTFLQDIAVLKPNVLPLVPKLMNRIYSEVKRKVGTHILKRCFLKLAVHQKERDLKRGIVSNATIWDKLIFSEVQKIMGGNVQFIFTASAPICKQIMQFFRCASGCLVFEAYGLSEVGAATMTLMSEHDSGFVGPPLPSNHIKLVSVPELSYDSADEVGEICIRGPNVFLGYYKNPTATKQAFDKAGWYFTGDIGKWLPNGALAIIDRKKHIFKLSQGEYIVPEKSESVYMHCQILSQVFVDGHNEEDFPVAIVVPDEKFFMKWIRDRGFPDSNYKALCQDKNVKIAVLKRMLDEGKREKLSSLQQVGNIFLCDEPFSVQNGLLTPTLKLKRHEARRQFDGTIHQLYKEGNLRKMLQL